MSVTITDIENAIVERMKKKWAAHGGITAVHEFDIGSDFESTLKTPAISVTTERIGLRHIVDMSFEIKPRLTIYMVFKNVGSLKGRRVGLYPMVLGAIGILAGQDLGIEIEPLMPDGSADEIFHKNLKELGLLAYKVSFVTSFDIERINDDEDVQKLIATGLYYYMKRDSEEADATDVVNLEE
ncbi:MAG TPA: phage protein Gp37 [Chitinispirillaceae bacterium]|nr:phage protein Gp37 [Chitinispirillaceae bacterium]